MKWLTRSAAIAVSAVLSACAAPLPTYPPMEPAAALDTLRERDAKIGTMTSTATVTLRDEKGSSVSFDAAIVAKWPDHLRLRAWKLGHAAFDLTFTPEGLWVYLPEEAKEKMADHGGFAVTGEQFGRVWGLFGPRALEGATVDAGSWAGSIVARRAIGERSAGGGTVVYDIDQTTLTVRVCTFRDAAGAVRQTLRLEDYRVFGGGPGGREKTVWPTRMVAEGDQGRVTIRLGTPEFNAEPAPEAFVPPRRATKQPARATD